MMSRVVRLQNHVAADLIHPTIAPAAAEDLDQVGATEVSR
jgi:hypothetical protein